MSEVRFTFEWYRSLLEDLLDAGYKFRFFDATVEPDTVFLRHDVDWSPRKAVNVAEIEADLGVSSTFFFLVSSPFYNAVNQECREAMERILEMGHDVGLHFSTHQYWEAEPTDGELVATVDRERSILATITDGDDPPVSFHNPPEWVLRRRFETFTSAYEPRFFESVEYHADSNQRWRDDPPLADGIPKTLQVVAHPVLWGERDGWTTDRLREERDYHHQRVEAHLERTDRVWRKEATDALGGGYL